MDYPDPDEEFELMHADEFELMQEIEDDEIPSSVITKPKPAPPLSSKRQLNFSNTAGPSTESSVQCAPKVVASANEYPSDDDLMIFQDAPNPELAEPPPIVPPSPSTVGSTNNPDVEPILLSQSSSNKRTISHLFGDISDIELELSSQTKNSSNKRTVSNLFGDISDIELEFSPQTKRQKLEKDKAEKDARQEYLIRKIVEKRNKINEEKTSSFKQGVSRKFKNLEDYMCTDGVPKWPFIPANVKGERIYIKLYSEEKIKDDMKNLDGAVRVSGLLGMPYKDLYAMAMTEISKKIEKKATAEKKNLDVVGAGRKELWVEKYKPKIYLQLLSDEATNRSLLYWLKLWDKVVFNREPKVLKNGFPGQERRDLLDETGRPRQKVALLCGPPGLGKTTLAHMIAKQAGYSPVEVNASDDRSAQAFRTSLEAATQMKSVIGSNPHPNCLILDEIDGAPQAAVDVLIKYVAGRNDTKKKKKNHCILRRPIICICNDIYVPALRSLRQIAFTIVFPPTSSSRLGERLMEISKMENIITDLGTMMVLSEKSNNDIRSCLSILQYMKAKSARITLSQIQSSTMGCKDMQQGLFSVWETIFQIKLSKKSSSVGRGTTNDKGFQLKGHLYDVLRTVQSYGDYDRLAAGVFENYAKIRQTDIPIGSVVKALDWFSFHDLVSTYIHTYQNYAVYAYLPWSFVQWHTLFASIQRPNLSYPTTYYDTTARTQKNQQVLEFAFSGMAPKLQSHTQRSKLLLDVAPLLLELVTPNVRPVSAQLYTQKEKDELQRVVSAMADYNLNYSQVRTPEGQYLYQLDPNIEDLVSFGERPRENITSYTVKQLLSKEVAAEKIRRAAAKSSATSGGDLENPPAIAHEQSEDQPKQQTEITSKQPEPEITSKPPLPNHLQKLTPKSLKKKPVEVQARDFFGRVVEKSLSRVKNKAKTDEIVKSDIWFHFKEGYNNAVRKNVYISDFI